MQNTEIQISNKNLIIGAIIGDVIGSVYEWNNVRTKDFPLFSPKTDFTDDSVLTFATMDVILNGLDYTSAYQNYARRYPYEGLWRQVFIMDT